MKFIVSSSIFLSRLQGISRVISAKPAQPILDNILLEIKDNELTVTKIKEDKFTSSCLTVSFTESSGIAAVVVWK